jgi:MFS family permease
MGYTEFYNFLIPLYGLSLGMSAGAIGMLVGARSLLAVFLSIHVGVLMDRFGTRRVTLLFVWTAMALAPVFPLLPWFWPLLLLQIGEAPRAFHKLRSYPRTHVPGAR